MTATLADLLIQQTTQQIFDILLGVYQAGGFPVESWQPLGTERTRLMATATALNNISAGYIPAFAAGGLLDYSSGTWLQLLAENNYNLPINLASYTQGNITLTSASATYAINAGDLIAVFGDSGNRYVNTAGGTVSSGSPLTLPFQAEFAGAKYNDGSNSGVVTLVTGLPGVTLTNPAATYTGVSHAGVGTGNVTPSGTPVGPHQLTVAFLSTGAAGAASWAYSLDGGPSVTAGALSALTNVGGVGINVTLTNGVSGTSFVYGDTYTFTTPGSWITVQGANQEDDSVGGALARRCKNRFSSLANIATVPYYELLAMSTPGVGSQVTQVVVQNDAVINNKVNIVVAGPAGALPGGAITAIQAYITARLPLADNATVVSPTPLNITLSGTITTTIAQSASAQALINTALLDYLDGLGINGTVRLAAITELIMQIPGVIDVAGVMINGSAANLKLGSATTFVIANPQAPVFSYVGQ